MGDGRENFSLKPRFQPLAGNACHWAAAANSGGGSPNDGHSQSEQGTRHETMTYLRVEWEMGEKIFPCLFVPLISLISLIPTPYSPSTWARYSSAVKASSTSSGSLTRTFKNHPSP